MNPTDATQEKNQPGGVPPMVVKKVPETAIPAILLHKAKSKHQLSLARLRVKRQFEQRENVDVVKHTQPTTEEEASSSRTKGQESVIPLETPTEGDISNPLLPTNSITRSATPSMMMMMRMIDFTQFSQEQSICFEPGPVGMQLEPVTQEDGLEDDDTTNNSDVYAAKIVRFVDGGPHNPGQARASGRLRPGDFVLRVEAEGVVGTSYYTVLHLLQKSWTTRTLTFRPAWDPSRMAREGSTLPLSAERSTSSKEEAATMATSNDRCSTASRGTITDTSPPHGMLPPTTRRSSPLTESNPLPYEWTPLPYDWVSRRPLPPEEERQQIYRMEVERLVQEAKARKEKQQQQQQYDQQGEGNQGQWDFGNVLISAVAISAESVAGCLRKHRGGGGHNDDEDVVYYEQSESHEKRD